MNRKTSIIIVTYNNLEYTKNCLDNIKKYTDPSSYEIIVIDNNSTDETRKYLKKRKDIKVIFNDSNLGFPKACNQGIKQKEKDNDVLLLNNDTIVTTNWLNNLKTCLYSKDDIGAAGAVCNQNENRQGVDFSYDDLEKMQQFALENNISNPARWEEKIFLIGFCLLIKKEVIDNLKTLDEAYSPGYIEDNDLSLRIVKLDYKLMLCHDCFIHHFLGTAFRKDLTKFYKILNKNREYFYHKWKFNTFSFDEIKTASFPLIEKPTKILELNAGIGVTILELKYKYKNIIIEGVEEDSNKRDISKHITTIYKNINDAKEYFYDYILIGNLLEQIKNPKLFLESLGKHLTPNGYIIGEFSNYSNIKTINKIINGYCKDIFKDKINFFSIDDYKRLLEDTSYKEKRFFKWYENNSEEEKKLLATIKNENIIYTYYTFKIKKEDF